MDASPLVNAVAEKCKRFLEGRDDSHSFVHIERVYKNASSIGHSLGLSERDMEIVQLAAVLHDIDDYKYAAEEVPICVKDMLLAEGYGGDAVAEVLFIIDNMSFSHEIAGLPPCSDERLLLLLGVVQDADRLDAIGAIGIARCLTYGGAKKRVLHNPLIPPRVDMNAEAYMASSAGTGRGADATTMNHFYEKLLKLAGMMKTDPGRKLAQSRHEFMLKFLDEFHEEWAGRR